jgi:hypothetical protein
MISYKVHKILVRPLLRILPSLIYTYRTMKQWKRQTLACAINAEPSSDSIELLKVVSKCGKSCEPGSKKECWGCESQMCAECSVEASPGVANTTHHLIILRTSLSTLLFPPSMLQRHAVKVLFS